VIRAWRGRSSAISTAASPPRAIRRPVSTRRTPAVDVLQDLREREAPIAIAIADQSAPGMSGLGLLRKARRLHPEIRTVLLCAHSDLVVATDAVNVGLLDHFLIKPFDGERDLLPIVTDLLEGWQGVRDRDAAGVRVVGERHSRGCTRSGGSWTGTGSITTASARRARPVRSCSLRCPNSSAKTRQWPSSRRRRNR